MDLVQAIRIKHMSFKILTSFVNWSHFKRIGKILWPLQVFNFVLHST